MSTRWISGWLAGSIALAGLAQAGPVVVFPPPIPSPDYGDFTLTASPGSVAIGKLVTATWTASPPGPSDWVGLYEAGAADGQFRGYCYTQALANGSCQLTVPAVGTWELRYYLGNPSYTLVAVSPRFEAFDPCVGLVHSLSVVGPLTGGSGRRLDVRWNVSIPVCFLGSDWIGVFAVDSPNTAYLGYFYPDGASGTHSVSATLAPGRYEFRYLPNGGYADTARSVPFTVSSCVAGDSDCDSRPDASDLCPYHAETNPLADTDGDGRGNECECSDQNGDGRNSVGDIVAINQALFDPSRVTPLCDGNGDGRCDVKDILSASLEIYSPGHTATCGRFPFLP